MMNRENFHHHHHHNNNRNNIYTDIHYGDNGEEEENSRSSYIINPRIMIPTNSEDRYNRFRQQHDHNEQFIRTTTIVDVEENCDNNNNGSYCCYYNNSQKRRTMLIPTKSSSCSHHNGEIIRTREDEGDQYDEPYYYNTSLYHDHHDHDNSSSSRFNDDNSHCRNTYNETYNDNYNNNNGEVVSRLNHYNNREDSHCRQIVYDRNDEYIIHPNDHHFEYTTNDLPLPRQQQQQQQQQHRRRHTNNSNYYHNNSQESYRYNNRRRCSDNTDDRYQQQQQQQHCRFSNSSSNATITTSSANSYSSSSSPLESEDRIDHNNDNNDHYLSNQEHYIPTTTEHSRNYDARNHNNNGQFHCYYKDNYWDDNKNKNYDELNPDNVNNLEKITTTKRRNRIKMVDDSHNNNDPNHDNRKMPAGDMSMTSRFAEQLYNNKPTPSTVVSSSSLDYTNSSSNPITEEEEEEEEGKEVLLGHQYDTKTIEVSPGCILRLRGADETWDAILNDYYMPHTCICCNEDTVFCIQDAEYFLCPTCKVINPILQQDANSKINNNNKELNEVEGKIGGGGGVGLGFLIEDLIHWQSRIAKERNIK